MLAAIPARVPPGGRPQRPFEHVCALPARPATSTAPSGNVCVIGGGIAGLTTAVRVKQLLPAVTLTVVAERFEDTTSHGAAGLWKPYSLGPQASPELVNRWGKATLDHYLQLYFSPAARHAGTILTSAYQLFKEPVPDPDWAGAVPHFRHLSSRELDAYDCDGTHSHGWAYTTVVTEGRLYLAWLRTQLAEAGVRLEARRVCDIAELATYDVVINCTGLGAKELVPDASMYAVRGHVVRVRAPWVRSYYNSEVPDPDKDSPCYIIPNTDTVVLGGTLGKDNYDTTPREEDRRGILERACKVLPSLQAAEFVSEWVGLRPGRPSVRLELEQMHLAEPQPGGKSKLPVVHNYGHGGAGLTLCWGCAGDVAQLVAAALV